MKKIKTNIRILCVMYYHLFTTEQTIRNTTNNDLHELLAQSYIDQEKLFSKRLEELIELISKNQKETLKKLLVEYGEMLEFFSKKTLEAVADSFLDAKNETN